MQAYQKGDTIIIFETKWKISDIPEACFVGIGKIKMMTIGKIKNSFI